MKLIDTAYIDMKKRVQMETLQASSDGPLNGEDAI